MDRNQEQSLRDELVALQQRHRMLDEEIAELELSGGADQLAIKRLKKEKLALKDRIYAIEDQLTPDIIA
ncbi:MAG: YdcH family protein [Alphaproteobacteria bacterium]|nr:YdcH family protein [Alphaproteobacteria bacterium]